MSMYDPAHPGEILKELVIEPLELSVTEAARHLGVSRKTLSKVLNGRGAVTPEMALRLEMTFGNRTPRTGFDCRMPTICGRRVDGPPRWASRPCRHRPSEIDAGDSDSYPARVPGGPPS